MDYSKENTTVGTTDTKIGDDLSETLDENVVRPESPTEDSEKQVGVVTESVKPYILDPLIPENAADPNIREVNILSTAKNEPLLISESSRNKSVENRVKFFSGLTDTPKHSVSVKRDPVSSFSEPERTTKKRESLIPSVILEETVANVSETQPTGRVLLAGDDKSSSNDSGGKLARIQNLMQCDSKGNIFSAIQMSQSGRYQGHKKNDPAFSLINYNDLEHIEDPHNLMNKGVQQRSLSGARLKMLASRASLVPHDTQGSALDITSSARANVLQATAEHSHRQGLNLSSEGASGKDSFEDDTMPSPTGSSTTFPTKVSSSKNKEDQTSGIDRLFAHRRSTVSEGNKLTFTTITKLKQWSRRASLKNSKQGVKKQKNYVKSSKHLKFLSEHADDVAISLPMPIKLCIVEEIAPILQKTVKGYVKHLGDNHMLTQEAKTKLTKTQQYMDNLSSL